MMDEPAKTTVAHQVELAVNRLESLSTLPNIFVQFFPKILQRQFSPTSLIDIIESDPALTAKIISLIEKRGLGLPDGRFSIRQALDKIPEHDFIDAVLSTNVLRVFSNDDDSMEDRFAVRKGLLLHSLAVACCAKDIAEAATPKMDVQLAYCAGLLHDIGKLALEEVMPKSFASILEEAQSTKQSFRAVEEKHLGADHTIIGKRLAQKWYLPNLIVLAIWLHHNQAVAISQDMPEARIAAIIQLADSIARQADIGNSGSYDVPESIEPLARCLGINVEQTEQIRRRLFEKVERKTEVLGLDLPYYRDNYSRVIHGAAAQFAKQRTELSLENCRLQSVSSHLNFITDFLLNINTSSPVIDIAEYLALSWQKFYQTGMVCLYFAPLADFQTVNAVLVENLAQSKVVCLEVPAGMPVIPRKIAQNFAIVDAYTHIDWIFDQLDVDFEASRTKLLPLISNGKAIGAIAFELHYPDDAELFEDRFRTSASIAGVVLGMALAQQRQQNYAEHFVRLISRPKDNEVPLAPSADLLNALAEMAAGAAHELNNPLAVISGRAQLLADAERDEGKKKILEQIYENSREASAIIEDLMIFAEPPKPRLTRTNIKQMLDEAVQLASQKTHFRDIDVRIRIAQGLSEVFVDSAQIVSAIANIISNAVESYTEEPEPIIITVDADRPGESVRLRIGDSGRGMDAQTVKKAVQPFFSKREAGRKRGVGLAYAMRFVQLNKGSLNIVSKPGEGTTVTIYLPC